MSSHTIEHHFDNKSIYDMLKYLSENDKLDIQQIQNVYAMTKKQELLNRHIYSIWQGKNDSKFYTYLPDDKKKRILVKRNTEEEIQNVVINYWKEQELNPTLQEVFDEWNDRRLELKKISASTHVRYIALFQKHFGDIKDKKIRNTDTEFLLNFMEAQIPKFSMTAKAFSNLKTLVKGMFKKAKRSKFIDFDIEQVFSELDIQEKEFHKVVKEDSQEVFSEEETDKIMSYLFQNLDIYNLGIILLFVTGMRIGELVVLQPNDFINDNRIVKIRKTETRYKEKDSHTCIYAIKEFPKTEAGVRDIIIPDDYLWVVKRLKMANPFGEFIFMNRGKRITTNSFRRRLKDICRKLDMPHKTPHKIRKTYGSILIDNNVDTRLITDLMGHTDIVCTERHYHRNRKSIDRKAEILSNIPDFQIKTAR